MTQRDPRTEESNPDTLRDGQAMNWRAEFEMLARAGLALGPGLTESEIERVESAVDATLPGDLRGFLSEGMPLGGRFPDWREPSAAAIREQLDWPFEGIAFDIEHNTFWVDAWGTRPSELADALSIARVQIAAAPRLIPIFGHRYLPAEPTLAGNPVLSVHQSDILYYGNDLATYLSCEFGQLPYADAVHANVRRVRFWSDLVDANG